MTTSNIGQTETCLVLNKEINNKGYWNGIGVDLWTGLKATQTWTGCHGVSSGANVVVMCGGDKRSVVCHAPILKQCSPLLEYVLNEENGQPGCERTIILPDTTSGTLLQCLGMWYMGEIVVSETEFMKVNELFRTLNVHLLNEKERKSQQNKNPSYPIAGKEHCPEGDITLNVSRAMIRLDQGDRALDIIGYEKVPTNNSVSNVVVEEHPLSNETPNSDETLNNFEATLTPTNNPKDNVQPSPLYDTRVPKSAINTNSDVTALAMHTNQTIADKIDKGPQLTKKKVNTVNKKL